MNTKVVFLLVFVIYVNICAQTKSSNNIDSIIAANIYDSNFLYELSKKYFDCENYTVSLALLKESLVYTPYDIKILKSMAEIYRIQRYHKLYDSINRKIYKFTSYFRADSLSKIMESIKKHDRISTPQQFSKFNYEMSELQGKWSICLGVDDLTLFRFIPIDSVNVRIVVTWKQGPEPVCYYYLKGKFNSNEIYLSESIMISGNNIIDKLIYTKKEGILLLYPFGISRSLGKINVPYDEEYIAILE